MKRSALAFWIAAIIVAAGDPIYWEVNAQDAASAASCAWHLREGGIQIVPSLTGVTCAVYPNLTGIFTCHAPLPALAQLPLGDHLLTLTEVCGATTSESDASNALAITVALPKAAQPRNLRTTAQ